MRTFETESFLFPISDSALDNPSLSAIYSKYCVNQSTNLIGGSQYSRRLSFLSVFVSSTFFQSMLDISLKRSKNHINACCILMLEQDNMS